MLKYFFIQIVPVLDIISRRVNSWTCACAMHDHSEPCTVNTRTRTKQTGGVWFSLSVPPGSCLPSSRRLAKSEALAGKTRHEAMQIAWQCKYILGEWANRPDDKCSRALGEDGKQRWRLLFGHLSFNDSEPIRRSEDPEIWGWSAA